MPVVVPSPASMSCDFDNSTNICAAGCWTSIFVKIVALFYFGVFFFIFFFLFFLFFFFWKKKIKKYTKKKSFKINTLPIICDNNFAWSICDLWFVCVRFFVCVFSSFLFFLILFLFLENKCNKNLTILSMPLGPKLVLTASATPLFRLVCNVIVLMGNHVFFWKKNKKQKQFYRSY